MRDRTISAVDVTIGEQTRLYHAYITTAPVAFDGPSTLTLYESSFADVAGFAADLIPFDGSCAKTAARLVLIGSTELEWQRARYREGQYLLAPTDPVLVGRNTLQHWLWHCLAMRRRPARCAEEARRNGKHTTATCPKHRPPAAGRVGGRTMNTFVKIIRNGHMAPGKLADAELHFTGGELDGLKLIGFAIWARRAAAERHLPGPTIHRPRSTTQFLAAARH